MKSIIALTLFFLLSCENYDATKNESVLQNTQIAEDPSIVEVKNKLKSYKAISRVEIRNYVKSNLYQDKIIKIKKIKATLVTKAERYIEMNFFTNESDSKAPLNVQFLLIDEKTKNILEDASINVY